MATSFSSELILRACAYCGGHWAGDDRKGDWYCPKHADHYARPFMAGDQIKFYEDDSPLYVALSIDGETVRYRRMGFPETQTYSASIHIFRRA